MVFIYFWRYYLTKSCRRANTKINTIIYYVTSIETQDTRLRDYRTTNSPDLPNISETKTISRKPAVLLYKTPSIFRYTITHFWYICIYTLLLTTFQKPEKFSFSKLTRSFALINSYSISESNQILLIPTQLYQLL